MSNIVFFSNNVWFFFTLCHPERDSGSHFYFFKKDFDSFFYHTTSSWTWFRISFYFFKKFLIFLFITSLFLFFHKNYYHFTKGKEPARSPKPAVSLPLNPSLLGHGLRRCLKNLPTSEVSSVSYEQICVALFFFKIVFDFFLFITSLFLFFL